MAKIEVWHYCFKTNKCRHLRDELNLNSIDDIELTLPQGVYTTFRTYHKNKALHLDLHLSRLVESIRLSGFGFGYKIYDLIPCLQNIVNSSPFSENRIRLHIPFSGIDCCYIFAEELPLLEKDLYVNGAEVKTNQISRNNPKAKVTSFIQESQDEKRLIKKIGLNESIMLNPHNDLLEGLSSNFFAIIDGKVWTAEQEVLHGITRKFVLEEIDNLAIPVILNPVNYQTIGEIDEAFITSTSRGVLPVRKIDDFIIRNGNPGDITRKIMECYINRIENEIKEI